MTTIRLTTALFLLHAGPLAAQEPQPVPTPLPVPHAEIAELAHVTLPALEAAHVARVHALAALDAEPISAALPLAELEHVGNARMLARLETAHAITARALARLEAAHATVPGHGLAALEALAAPDIGAGLDALPPEGWAPQDPADSLWRAARRYINDGQYERAAELYFRLHQDDRFRASEYRAQAYYWEAFARARIGGQGELRRARASLEAMRARHAEEWRAQRDAPALLSRINGELAQRGDARAAEEIQQRGVAVARASCDPASMAMKVEAMNALLQMDAEQAMPVLEEVMKKRDECSADLRRKAIFLISQKQGERSQQLIIAALQDPDPEVRQQAVFWLSQVNSDVALPALEQVLTRSTDAKLQEHALFALSQHKAARANEILRAYATRGGVGAGLRKHAIFALGQRPDGENTAFLKEIYPRIDREAKEMVIFSIGQQRDESAAQWLLELALNEREPTELRKHALFLAGQRPNVDVMRLGQMYERMPDREMKGQVIFALSQRRDAAAVDRMLEIARNEKDPELRKQAIFWLGQSKDPRAARFLLDIINN